MRDLKIQLGSADLPRFSCACHKLNLAVRHAISSHSSIQTTLKRLNSCNVSIRRCIALSTTFREKKCRLRIENETRWYSAYLILESVKSAYDRGGFDDTKPELTCPVTLSTVELYLKILKPAYLFSVSLQDNRSSIAHTISGKKVKVSSLFENELNSNMRDAFRNPAAH